MRDLNAARRTRAGANTMTFSGTPPRNCAASPSKALGRAPRATRGGTRNVLRGLQPRPTMTTPIMGWWVHGYFEFITYYFNGLSLSPRRSDSGTVFMGSTHSGPPTPRQAMTEDSTEEFHTVSSGGGGSGLPSPRRLSTGAPPAPVITLPWQEDAPAI
jgi:hypothetical protein